MNKKLIEKLNKLFAIAERSTFPEEAASALGKAQALMTQHDIGMETLKDSNSEEPEEDIVCFNDDQLNRSDKGKMNKSTCKACLGQILSTHNGCFVFTQGPRIIITGKPSNVSSVRYLYAYCEKEIDRITKLNCVGKGRTYANNFRLGCVKAIDRAIIKEKEEIRNNAIRNNKSLVVIDKVLTKYRKDANLAKIKAYADFNLKSTTTRNKYDDRGREAGLRAGSKIYKGNGSRSLPAPQRKIGY